MLYNHLFQHRNVNYSYRVVLIFLKYLVIGDVIFHIAEFNILCFELVCGVTIFFIHSLLLFIVFIFMNSCLLVLSKIFRHFYLKLFSVTTQIDSIQFHFVRLIYQDFI